MKLGMTMFSFHNYAREGRIDVAGFLRFAADVGLETVDLLAYYWRDERDEPDEARELIDDLGLELAAYAVGNNFVQEDPARFREQVEVVRQGIEMAYRLGAPAMRVFGGQAANVSRAEAMKLSAEGLSQVVEEAAEAQVVLAVENHSIPGPAEEVVALLTELDSPWVRACVDVGNFVPVGEDPAEAVATVVGYARHTHIKDFRREEHAGRVEWRPCMPGRGDIDYRAVVRAFADGGYTGALSIEAEGPEDDYAAAEWATNWLREVIAEVEFGE
jgi:sugar phosphate isomerase/epimerase